VTAEVKLSAELIQKHLQTTPEAMADYWRMSAIGSVLNGLAALYLATG
jgi:hydroxymethylglutaryl-CoA reductase (NADPH)